MPRTEHPPFGQADLSNCERELIHLSGSIQPHGLLLVLAEPHLQIVQVSGNIASQLGWTTAQLLGQPIDILGDECAAALRDLRETQQLTVQIPCQITLRGATREHTATMLVHRPPQGGLIVELEDVHDGCARRGTAALPARLAGIVTRLSAAPSIPALADLVVEELQDLIGYDRVMVYRFDEVGHGEIIAEAKRQAMESFLHRHYPATDIPQRARELYLRNKVRLLVDVHYTPVPLEPRLSPLTGEELDLSMAGLRSISPLHIEYLKNMGVEATLVASLVHEGRLWGLISCHHRTARYLPYDLRAACELLAEVVSTRISALEHFAEAQAEVLVRRLEHRLIEEAHDGDWRRALFDAPRQLLAPVGATGAALIYDGEVHTTGDVPSTPDLRALFAFIDTQEVDQVFATSSIAQAHPPFASMSAVAAGVLAVRLGPTRGEYLAWFRAEQLQSVTWGGDPRKPVILSSNMELSPRRSFAAWHEQVRETSIAWSLRETAIAKAIGASLSDIILQMRAVRVLLAESQLASMRAAVLAAAEPVIIADDEGRVMLVNAALSRLVAGPHKAIETLEDLASRFEDPAHVHEVFHSMRVERRPWRGELRLKHRHGDPGTPVALRADPIPTMSGGLFGVIIILNDLTARQEAEQARLRLQQAIFNAQRPPTPLGADVPTLSPAVQALVSAVWANAGVAVSEIADSAETSDIAPRLTEVETATRHAAHLSALLGRYAADGEGVAGS